MSDHVPLALRHSHTFEMSKACQWTLEVNQDTQIGPPVTLLHATMGFVDQGAYRWRIIPMEHIREGSP